MPWRSGSPHGVFSAGDGTEVPGETAKIWVNAGTTCIAALTARAAAAVIGLDQRFRMMTSSACYRPGTDASGYPQGRAVVKSETRYLRSGVEAQSVRGPLLKRPKLRRISAFWGG